MYAGSSRITAAESYKRDATIVQRPALINASDYYNRNYNEVCNAEEIGKILCIRGTVFKAIELDSVKIEKIGVRLIW